LTAAVFYSGNRPFVLPEDREFSHGFQRNNLKRRELYADNRVEDYSVNTVVVNKALLAKPAPTRVVCQTTRATHLARVEQKSNSSGNNSQIRLLRVILFVFIFNTPSLLPLFAQTAQGYEDQKVQDFAEALGNSLSFASSMGLNWSSPYVGQLIGYPVHFGIGVSLGSAFMGNAAPADLGEMLGIPIEDSMVKSKQWLPYYVVSARLGGLGGVPFDIGFKLGYIPETAIWGPLDYTSLLFGVDVHYAVFVSDEGPIVAFGVGVDTFEGDVTGELGVDLAVPSGETYNSGSPVRLAWNSTTFKAQFFLAQQVWVSGLSFFCGLEIGYGMNQAGLLFGSDKYDPDFSDMRDVSGLAFSSFGGLGFEINELRIDLNLMVNFINFEGGFNISFRYQR
jgi:hypothetical protein